MGFMLVALVHQPIAGAPLQIPSAEARSAIQETQAIARTAGESVWSGFGSLPLQVLLVEEEQETLFCARNRAEFTHLGRDNVTGCEMQARQRVLAPDTQASFDVFGDGHNYIVMDAVPGDPNERLGWISALLHEQFHQLQASRPNFARPLAALNARMAGPVPAGGEHWMLAYPFPYQRPEIGALFDDLVERAQAFLDAPNEEERRRAVRRYAEFRRLFQDRVATLDWMYFEQQMWSEGVARWTEAEISAAQARASGEDIWRDRATEAREAWRTSLSAIRRQGVRVWKRSAFYTLGAIEADMLRLECRDWHTAYWRHPFELGPLFEGRC